MLYPWFHKTEADKCFYEAHIRGRLPKKMLDAHVHMNRQEHLQAVSEETIFSDWAVETGLHMDYEGYRHYYSTLFPEQEVEINAFPFPLPEVNIPANNDYLGELADEGKIRAMMSVRPEWDAEYCEAMWDRHHFVGIKPYPYMAAKEKGADISIFDFMPHHQLVFMNQKKTAMTLHLPRHGRLPDPANVRELLEIRQKYPDIKIIIAHLGRCFDEKYFLKGMEALGAERNDFYYDCAAITNAAVYQLALEKLNEDRILFGTDEPIFLWHGEQSWNEAGSAINAAREDFSWNTRRKSPEEEGKYVFILYLQLKNLLDAIGDNEALKQKIFYENADFVLR